MSEPTTPNNELYHWIIHGMIASYAALITWLGKGIYNDVKELKQHQADCKLDLANFKTEVVTNYSKETSTQASLSRLYGQMENLADKETVKKLSDDVGEINRDIKSILKMVGNGRSNDR